MEVSRWSCAKRLFSVEILDDYHCSKTALEVESHSIDSGASANSQNEASTGNSDELLQPQRRTEKSQWRSIEIRIYLIVLAVCLFQMIKTILLVSRTDSPNFTKYSSLLIEGWIPGRLRDNSDVQYSGFRNNLLLLTLVAFIFCASKHITYRLNGFSSLSSEQQRYLRDQFNLYSGICFLTLLIGINALKIYLIVLINYGIAKLASGHKAAVIFSWTFNISLLFLMEWYHGFPLAMISPKLASLDTLSGFLRPYHTHFRFSLLRIISFVTDYHWSASSVALSVDDAKDPNLQSYQVKGLETVKSQSEESPSTAATRANMHHQIYEYDLKSLIEYISYPPLYIAGPIITFNDWKAQTLQPSSRISTSFKLLYTIRFLACLLTMELIQHYAYVVAIAKTQAWENCTFFQLCMIAYFNLIFIWLKLLIPWRFFRLWALLDDLKVPENMVRCMSNNYSPMAFWRAWHRTLNRWIVRYIYVPLGGNKHLFLNSLLIFSFVAIWHDIQLRLLIWGWLVVLFIVPEIIGKRILPENKFGKESWYRFACSAGCTLNILLMMTVNLIGFGFGFANLKGLFYGLFSSIYGIGQFALIFLCLMIGTQLMFQIRENESNRGVKLRC